MEIGEDSRGNIFNEVGNDTPLGPGGETPARTPEVDSPHKLQNSRSGSPAYDVETGDGERNPEPPPELAKSMDLLNADNIGGTVFSKHWVFSTLMKLIQEVEKDVESKDPDEIREVNEDLQDELCKLWDIAMDKDVAAFLQEFQAVEILTGVIAKSHAPRLTEISIGILGNMACHKQICPVITENNELVKLTLLLLETPDAPTLIQITRLLYVCLSSEGSKCSWIPAIKQHETVLQNILFVFNSSTNNDLLKNMGELVDKLLEMDEEICTQWATVQFVQSLHEAIKQIGERPGEIIGTYFHICQLLSTTEVGVQALVSDVDNIGSSLLLYLDHTCNDDTIKVIGEENVLASAICVLNSFYMSAGRNSVVRDQEKQLTRNLLKILEVVSCILNDSQLNTNPTNQSNQGTPHSNKLENTDGRNKKSTEISNLSTTSDSTSNTHKLENGSNPSKATDSPISNTEACKSSPLSKRNTPGSSGVTPTSDAGSSQGFSECSTLLYNTVQGFLVDILQSIPQASQDHTPDFLDYMNRYCPSERLQCLLTTLKHMENRDLIQTLLQHSRNYQCEHFTKGLEDFIKSTNS
ncbi:unnamed protein product [Owenia fusiformis]|uniref:Uncharacterized protein n=1 Tax=Owenia fusiformis TaxID=6347 RepID=A0A8J1V095_OWEFU|nr:unnamed protein product [Owenia fusiformis]